MRHVLISTCTVTDRRAFPPFTHTIQQTYIAPSLLLILPLIYLSTELPKNGFLILTSIAVPTLYGLAITDLRVLSSAILLAVAFSFVEAGKLAFAKKWFISRSSSPLETMVQYLPVSRNEAVNLLNRGLGDHAPQP